MDEVNVCCPYLRTNKCEDTKAHRHLICRAKIDVMPNSDVLYQCISDGKYLLCSFYIPIKDGKNDN